MLRGRFTDDGHDWLREPLAQLARVELVDDGSNGDVVAAVTWQGGTLELLPSEALDPAEAERRLAARREFLTGEIERAENKLANEKFVERAPAEVVEEERRKLEDFRDTLRSLG
jgi:valyl-tRNA synthetase